MNYLIALLVPFKSTVGKYVPACWRSSTQSKAVTLVIKHTAHFVSVIGLFSNPKDHFTWQHLGLSSEPKLSLRH